MKRALTLLVLALTACGSKSIDGVQTFTYSGGDHRSGSLIYAENPPAGGPHNPAWQNCGVYDRPLYNEYVVHSLEHGAVWITYRPDLDAAQVAALKTLVEGRPYTILSPYEGLDTPVAASAWGAQLKVEQADDSRLKAFLDKYEQGATAPERGASCSGAYGETR
ncbi:MULTISPECIES: DUF3105 domain-containing protein [Deinococcus]|jgi:hypothetical protein|uniref:DUF3105 domain-containing protein n=2 Tax=Deinococcus soli (ex Cha et al. 2016) TaxID=1309411 RepID=A0A0F7JKV1_9DEIO|nr:MULTISPECIES: DUF3105 domain-containing protein [Deinococcus]AKH16891.1 hypothetical protein SY84_07270 [Deinococcus soli (ex Cha et al. 2016)]MDK2012315.1 DUF3105 domain-containing protein [Deinococcus sp. 43]MDR6219758.1 hypothetical protein [Deinococcus soli (ex Cha et al. 2016)]MDR6329642.1 hypothetical protein [Deinococcus soli (ex Cha et al. 2016)]MDR6752665.1 hypothetical protein [Deinococcus soli (ex Cha et al. 2016)]